MARDQIDWEKIIIEFEHLVIVGHHDLCRERLEHLPTKKVPREFASRLAEIAWRSNAFLEALVILRKHVSPQRNPFNDASCREKMIFGSSLASLGAVNAGIEILKKLIPSTDPLAYFHLASAFMYDWNYGAAIPILQEYVEHRAATPYQIVTGKVNLAACFIKQRNFSSAEILLQHLKRECLTEGYDLLLGNVFELQAQLQLAQRNYMGAKESLISAHQLLLHQKGNYSLYVEKWMAIVSCFLSSNESELAMSLNKIEDVKRSATILKHWNTVRSCDLYIAYFKKDENLHLTAVVGSPSDSFRKEAGALFRKKVEVPQKIFIRVTGHNKLVHTHLPPIEEKQVVFDSLKPTVNRCCLADQPTLYKLFYSLLSDFYQPLTLGMIFQLIYPGEVFDPFNSPKRVLHLMKRLEGWFLENQLPLRIEFAKSEFSIYSDRTVFLDFRVDAITSAMPAMEQQLKSIYLDDLFSKADVCNALGVSQATAERLISNAVKSGRMTKRKKFKTMSYQFLRIEKDVA